VSHRNFLAYMKRTIGSDLEGLQKGGAPDGAGTAKLALRLEEGMKRERQGMSLLEKEMNTRKMAIPRESRTIPNNAKLLRIKYQPESEESVRLRRPESCMRIIGKIARRPTTT